MTYHEEGNPQVESRSMSGVWRIASHAIRIARYGKAVTTNPPAKGPTASYPVSTNPTSILYIEIHVCTMFVHDRALLVDALAARYLFDDFDCILVKYSDNAWCSDL